MLRLVAASLLLAPASAAIALVSATSMDAEPILLDEIEGAKSARLMKNKEDIDVQSTFHEEDIKETGDVPDELAARLVRNRGPITAKVIASGTHQRHCTGADIDNENCDVDFSLVAWKFAGDAGTVHGSLEEKFRGDGKTALRVEVDCMKREDGMAIVGGTVSTASTDGVEVGQRAYVKVSDRGEGGDFISHILAISEDGSMGCGDESLGGMLLADTEGAGNFEDARVSVCSKRNGDWEKCLEKAKAEQAIE